MAVNAAQDVTEERHPRSKRIEGLNEFTWFLLALPLALDVFAAGLVFGLAGLERSRWLTIAAGFAAVGGALFAAGMLLGDAMEGTMGKAAMYVAGAVLVVIGARGIKHGLPTEGIKPIPALTTRKVLMTMVAVAVDKLAVGLSFAVLEAPLGLLTAIVAGQAFVAVLIGLWLGKRLGARAGDFAELIAGVVFTLLGLAVFYKGYTG